MVASNLRLADKVVVITGSSSGIGRATALALAAQGPKLLVCADLNPGTVDKAVDGTPTHDIICALYGTTKAVYVVCDITATDTPGDMDHVVAEAIRLGGRLDVLINNAGLFLEGPLHETSNDDWNRVMNVNATGTFYGCRAAIRQFLIQDEDENGARGAIVNVSSCAALKGLFRCSSYCASKAAIAGLSREIAVEYGTVGIRCNTVCPGYTETSMLSPWLEDPDLLRRFLSAIPSGKLAQPSDITGAIIWLACGAESSYVNGTTIAVDAGFHIK